MVNQQTPARPHAELLLQLTTPHWIDTPAPTDAPTQPDNAPSFRRVSTRATLIHRPADPQSPATESAPFDFVTPIGILELEDLRWYLEFFPAWPGTAFRPRANRVESQIQQWGQALYQAAVANAPEVLATWQNDPAASRRFSVHVNSQEQPNEGTESDADGERDEAAAHLLALPWELLHPGITGTDGDNDNDGTGYLFQADPPTRVRRLWTAKPSGSPTQTEASIRPAQPVREACIPPPIRILLVTARPEADGCPYIDHRASAAPLVAAMETLGDLVDLTLLTEPTFEATLAELQAATDRDAPYHVLHFDGHGNYAKLLKQGALLFEHPTSLHKLADRHPESIPAKQLATELAPFTLPLVFLEACQTATAETDVNGSVASALLAVGVGSVVAMSHKVLVETARRFVVTFYAALGQGQSVGDAMLAGQRKLHVDPFRGRVFGAGHLHLQDWFVPVLFQSDADPVLFQPTDATTPEVLPPQPELGRLPPEPATCFIGRSKELLVLQRLLFPPQTSTFHTPPHWVLVRGQGGEGKTALATEFARWSLRAGLVSNIAFVSVETDAHEEAFLLQLGQQLIGDHYLPAHDPTHQQLTTALQASPTLLLVDNCETLEPDFFHDDRDAILTCCQALLAAAPQARLLFTSREPLPAPFQADNRLIPIDRLARPDAKRLIERSLNLDEQALFPDTEHAHEEELNALIDATQGHARTLSLLAPHLKTDGIAATTQNLTQLMIEMEERFPGEREQSLFASIELSLQRLSPASRELCKPLGTFKGVANFQVLRAMTGLETPALSKLATEMVHGGLATRIVHDVFRFHPALCPYLSQCISDKDRPMWQTRWIRNMDRYAQRLVEFCKIDPRLSAQISRAERPNIAALLTLFPTIGSPAATIQLCMSLFQILEVLDETPLLKKIATVIQAAQLRLSKDWSHAHVQSAAFSIELLLERGDIRTAQTEAESMLKQAALAGPECYHEAAYDIEMARWTLGKVKAKHSPKEALPHLKPAMAAFLNFPGSSAVRMASACQAKIADCLMRQGKLSQALDLYKKGIVFDEKHNYKHGSLVGLAQIGSIYIQSGEYAEALKIWDLCLKGFTSLNEPSKTAGCFHSLGAIHSKLKNIEKAETSFRKSLQLQIQSADTENLGKTYGELAELLQASGRFEDAALNHRQAMEIADKRGDLSENGRHCHNLAFVLMQLEQFATARPQIERALKCKSQFGTISRPWKSWHVLHKIESLDPDGDPSRATKARDQARALYLVYRRDGGENNLGQARVCRDVRRLMEESKLGGAKKLLFHLAERANEAEDPIAFQNFLNILRSITNGSREEELAYSSGLDYEGSVEIQLLLEVLNRRK